jgi:hypothetical protein
MSAPRNTGTTILKLTGGKWAVQPRSVFPIRNFRLTGTPTPAQVTQQFNQSQDEVQDATVGSRDVAGTVRTLYVAVPFTGGIDVQLPHLLGSANIGVWLGQPRGAVGSGIPYVTWTVSPDGTAAILVPAGTFTADLEFRVIP